MLPSQHADLRDAIYTILVHTAFRNLGSREYLEKAERQKVALQYLDAAAKHEPLTPAFYYVRAKWNRRVGDDKAADDDERRAAALAPSMALDYYIPARIAHGENDKDAIRFYRLALRQDPSHFPSMDNLGVCLARQGRLEEALLCFLMTVARHPRDYIPHSNVAQYYLHAPMRDVDIGASPLDLAEKHLYAIRQTKAYDAYYDNSEDFARLIGQYVLQSLCQPMSKDSARRLLEWTNEAKRLAPDPDYQQPFVAFCRYRMGRVRKVVAANQCFAAGWRRG